MADAATNRERLDRAVNLLHEAAVAAMNDATCRIKRITVTVPIHGNQLGTPRQSIEKE